MVHSPNPDRIRRDYDHLMSVIAREGLYGGDDRNGDTFIRSPWTTGILPDPEAPATEVEKGGRKIADFLGRALGWGIPFFTERDPGPVVVGMHTLHGLELETEAIAAAVAGTRWTFQQWDDRVKAGGLNPTLQQISDPVRIRDGWKYFDAFGIRLADEDMDTDLQAFHEAFPRLATTFDEQMEIPRTRVTPLRPRLVGKAAAELHIREQLHLLMCNVLIHGSEQNRNSQRTHGSQDPGPLRVHIENIA